MENTNPACGMDCTPSESTPKIEAAQAAVQAEAPVQAPALAQAAPATAPTAAFTAQTAPVQAVSAPPFPADKKDALFALFFLALGYLFVKWVLFELIISEYTSLYTVLYAGVVLAYVFVRGKRPTAESWFWLAVMLCLGVPAFSFYSFPFLLDPILQFLLLLLVAAYWTLCVNSALYEGGGTSNFIPLDAANAMLFTPFGNFLALPRALWRGVRGGSKQSTLSRRVLYVASGALLSIPLLLMVLPSLFDADERFTAWFSGLFNSFSLGEHATAMLFGLPVALFLFGLCFGALHKRHTEVLEREGVRKFGIGLRKMPSLVTATALGLVCGIYFLFILFQSSYLFSAFLGRLPEDFTFAEYARDGFFELCRVCGMNVAFLLGANLLSKESHTQSKTLRCLNLVLSGLTLLLVATAGSKMGLYIAEYGLTPLRVLSSVFLLWLAIVFTLVIVWQWKPIRPVRLAVLAGAALVAVMCALPVMDGIDAYNEAHGYSSATNYDDDYFM